MSLPAPELDDRKFQDIVDDVKRQIGRRCPEWTDHNVSDPGVTLIELFAWMTEMSLYRMNQVPEKNYVKFLEMIGISLESPAPALTELRFRLSRPIADKPGEEANERTLPARKTVAATQRTENEEAVEFTTERDLRLVRPRLGHILALPTEANLSEGEMPQGAREFNPEKPPAEGFAIFGATPRRGDALYLGFENDVSSCLIELEADCLRSAAQGLNEEYPAQRWEVWNGAEMRWEALEVLSDTTFGFNRGPGQIEAGPDGTAKTGMTLGLIELAMPAGLLARQVGGKKGYWIRCVYDTDLPPRGPEHLKPAPYLKPPRLLELAASAVGGTVSASNCATVINKDLGQSDGRPGQVFALGQAPILPLRPGEHILVGEQGAPYSEWDVWEEVEDFADSGPQDRHFVCDTFRGEIYFGPSVPQADGTVRQHGKIPEPTGSTIAMSAFRYGGGTRGNVAPDQVIILKSSLPYISEVTNPRRAAGGRLQETLESAKLRARSKLRSHERAVTAEDYEFLATNTEHCPEVGRARCVQPRALHRVGVDGVPPGVVRMLLIPALDPAVTTPRPAELRISKRAQTQVETYLDERRLLTSVLEVGEPEYLYISTDIVLVADPKADPDEVARAVKERLAKFIHPLRGGPNGDGWPFHRTLTLADIYAQVQEARGVAFLLDAKIFVSRVINAAEGLLGPEVLVSNAEGARLSEMQMLASRDHRVRARPIYSVGESE